jgi:hypothetical protein
VRENDIMGRRNISKEKVKDCVGAKDNAIASAKQSNKGNRKHIFKDGRERLK